MFSRLIRVVAWINSSLLSLGKCYSIGWMHHILFICPSGGDEYACYFFFMAIANNAVMNMGAHIFSKRVFSVLFDTHLGVGLLGHLVALCLII